MEILLLALTVGLPLIKILLFPARTMSRGGNWTIVGAAMIVGLMMVVWFAMQSVTDTGSALLGSPASKADAQAQAEAQHDLDNLAKLL